MDREALEREAEWRRCANDELYFLENYWQIRHPAKGAIPFELRDPQKTILALWQEEPFTLSLKARQVGWSTLVAGHVFHFIYFTDDRPVIMLSRTERDAKKLLEKLVFGYERLPDWMVDRGPDRVDNTTLRVKFSNSSMVESLPSRENAARGESASLIVVDEWAFLNDPEDAWASIEPATDIGGRIIGISTANGAGNWFHGFYRDAKAGVNDFKTMFFPWQVVPERNEEWYARKKAKMEEWQLHQEYPYDDDECFAKSGRPVFDVDKLKELEIAEFETGYMHFLEGVWQFIPSNAGGQFAEENQFIRMYERPEAGWHYVIGADVAKGVRDGDNSTAHVICRETGRVCAVFEGKIAADMFGDLLHQLGLYFHTAYIGVENATHGMTTLYQLRNLKYPRLHREIKDNGRYAKQTTKLGWTTSGRTKPLMIDDMNAAIRESDIAINDERTINEMTNYAFVTKGNATIMEGKPHDDLVISLCIANQMLKVGSTSGYSDPVDNGPVELTFAWFEKQLNDQSAHVNDDTIGIGVSGPQEGFVIEGPPLLR